MGMPRNSSFRYLDDRVVNDREIENMKRIMESEYEGSLSELAELVEDESAEYLKEDADQGIEP